MVINFDKKYIFIEIPKTGTTSIRHTFVYHDGACDYKDNVLRHGTLKQAFSKFKDIKDSEYFKFCFVRNPWDLVVSFYFWCKNTNHIHERTTFKHYVTHDKQFIKSQSHWINNISDFDFIGRFENIREDYKYICDKVKISKPQLKHYNSIKHKHYTEYYDDETREIIAKIYAKDIEYFGYEFGE